MKNAITVVFTVCFISGFAQTFQGKATYKTHRKVSFEMKKSEGGANSDMQKKLQEQLMKIYQKTYTLNFSKSESTYKQNEELSAPQQNGTSVEIMIMGSGGGSDVLYKNITEKRFSKKTEISGKRFLIKDNLKDNNWELTGETKNIGKYTCYKATAEMKAKKMGEEETTETVIVTAWYTPEIPVSNGPGKYWGLPGLILEIQEGKHNTIICSEIILNPSDKVKIKEPKKGKKITQKKFDKVMKQKSEEMIERFKNRRKGDGNVITIDVK